ncbi:lytic murein transglycosylase [Palleronia sp. LCG004]|uniref:lytic murein transglycosylase n=1 Tax=Palleronia sp. LCG004 TaxID=3079304 RepID=UPI0029420D05|nr:lytic murein transglycosylase [Palleronia sp. LCG004]WOI56858.1 lytic murein transglycosylase [Palleronia sp. LCG004]
MRISRRIFMGGVAASGLAACGGGAGRLSPVSRDPLPDDLRPVPNAGWSAWVDGFRGRAASQGLSPEVVARSFRGAGYLPGVVERDRNQTEFTRSLEDYLAIAASEEKVATGRRMYGQYRPTLDAIEARYGVPANVVAAIWGLESNYGSRRGNIPIVSSTSTLAYDGRRGQFFESQLLAALRIIERGDTTPENMVGSWAGAMGHTQFIPTSYQAFAVDFTGDGRRDIWADDPSDALASTAAYLSRSGWQRGMSWGGEVGVSAPASGSAITPQPGGPTFRVTRNFDAIKRYNNSTNYAIGVGHLSDRIAGGPPIRASFPPDRYGFTKDMREDLQRRLTRAGYDTQGTDGVLGPNSRTAIAAYQGARGLPPTGDPSVALLNSLGG